MLSIPTPVGSIIKYSGFIVFAIVRIEAAKSPFLEQQMQPLDISHILSLPIPASFNKSPSIPRAPYSFSNITNFLPVLEANSLIKVVFPAPKNPDTTRTFINPLF